MNKCACWCSAECMLACVRGSLCCFGLWPLMPLLNDTALMVKVKSVSFSVVRNAVIFVVMCQGLSCRVLGGYQLNSSSFSIDCLF